MRSLGRGRAVGLTVAVAAGLFALATAPTSVTEAAWTDREHATGAMTAGEVRPATGLRCTGSGLLAPVTYAWTAPSGGLGTTGYRWTVTGGLSASGTLAATATSITLESSLLGTGSGTFSLYAVGPGQWESPAASGRLSFTTGLVSSCSVP